MKNKILVQICDKEYSLLTEESEEYVKSLSLEVTKMIENTAYKNLRTSKLDAAMVTCLELCDKNRKLSEDNDNMRREIVGYIDEIGKLSKKLAPFERQKSNKSFKDKIEDDKTDEEISDNAADEIETEEFDNRDGHVKTNVPVYRKF